MSAHSKHQKRSYHRPQLRMYGDIKTLTLALSTADINPDSGDPTPGAINKTF